MSVLFTSKYSIDAHVEVPYCLELRHPVQRPNFERVSHLKIKQNIKTKCVWVNKGDAVLKQ